VNISRSSLVEGEHTPIIVHVILSMDHDSIQLKNSLKIFCFPIITHNKWRFKKLTRNETDYIVKGTLGKKLHQDRWTRYWTFHSKNFIYLLANQWTKSWTVSHLCKPSQQTSHSNFPKSILVLCCVHFCPGRSEFQRVSL